MRLESRSQGSNLRRPNKRLVHDGALVPRSRSAPRPAAQPQAVGPAGTSA